MKITRDRFKVVETVKDYIRLIADFKEKGIHTEPFSAFDGYLGFVADWKWYGIDARILKGKPSLPAEISALNSMLEWTPEEWREKREQIKALKED